MNETEKGGTSSEKKLYIWVMLVGTLFAGGAFVLKLAEFLHTLESPDVEGFVAVPVTVYFIVAAGWACMLGWAWSRGSFARIEEPKYRMLEQEMEYERLERQQS
ncbi:MAG: hypothetical protein ACE5E4_08930 [Candidatus Binatia bacterium]